MHDAIAGAGYKTLAPRGDTCTTRRTWDGETWTRLHYNLYSDDWSGGCYTRPQDHNIRKLLKWATSRGATSPEGLRTGFVSLIPKHVSTELRVHRQIVPPMPTLGLAVRALLHEHSLELQPQRPFFEGFVHGGDTEPRIPAASDARRTEWGEPLRYTKVDLEDAFEPLREEVGRPDNPGWGFAQRLPRCDASQGTPSTPLAGVGGAAREGRSRMPPRGLESPVMWNIVLGCDCGPGRGGMGSGGYGVSLPTLFPQT